MASGDDDRDHRGRISHDLLDHGRLDAARQLESGAIHAFADFLSPDVAVFLEIEAHRDHRESVR